jgi:hypothetical protein
LSLGSVRLQNWRNYCAAHLPGTENADQPAEEMSERHDHGKNFSPKIRIQLFAKSFILQVYDVLARHNQVHLHHELEFNVSDLSLAKTPRPLNVIHGTCDTASSYVIDFRCVLDFGEGTSIRDRRW